MSSLSVLEAPFLDVTSIRLTIVHSKIKKDRKRNLVLVDKDAHQRETITKWPIWLALMTFLNLWRLGTYCARDTKHAKYSLIQELTISSTLSEVKTNRNLNYQVSNLDTFLLQIY